LFIVYVVVLKFDKATESLKVGTFLGHSVVKKGEYYYFVLNYRTLYIAIQKF